MDDSVALIFNNALQKIFSQSSRKNIQLREACKIAQETIRDSPCFSNISQQQQQQQQHQHQSASATTTSTPGTATPPAKISEKEWDLLGNKLVTPMKLACETKEPKLMAIALDSLDKLMGYGIIKPNAYDEAPVAPGGEKKRLIEKVVDIIGSYFDYQEETVQLQIIKSLLTAVITPTCDIHDTCLMNAIRSCYNIHLVSQNKINFTAAKSALFQMVDCVLHKFEHFSQLKIQLSKSNTPPAQQQQQQQAPQPSQTPANSNANNHSSSANDESAIIHQYNVNLSDVILLFRAFCKLSTKEVPDGSSSESHEVKSKILSLELLSRILENPLPSLKLSEKFINTSIKRYLSVSLLTNGSSNNLPEFKLTLAMFLSLMIHFKEHLKEEIGTFFSKIILATLASSTQSVKKKWLVLPVLCEICKNPQTIVDIFVNYDCDPERKDIFEKMVYELSRVAQGTSSVERTSSQEEVKFKMLGLECIVTIMNSLVDWSKEIYESKRIEQQTRAAALNFDEAYDDVGSPLQTSTSPLKASMDESQRQSLLEQATQKFNAQPKKGIEFLIQCGMIKENPTEIAELLRMSPEFDQKLIGTYLCQQNSFNVSVLYKYIDSFDLKKMEIDQSLQMVLACIQLNGENKAIDRIVEKLAEKYFFDNPDASCANAESVYLLAYAIIILSTDLHNVSIKSKITKEEWLKMNSKSNNKVDFEDKYLLDIYDRVSQETYRLGYTNSDEIGSLDSQEILLRFNKDSDYIVKQCQELMKTRISKKTTFYRARNIEHVRPMFLLSWCYVLSTLSVILDDTKDRKLISLCLDGFASAIRVSCIFYMNVERSSFITSLSKLCLLDTIKEPSLKHIDCIKHLITIANNDGNYLQDSWTPILKTICILERLHLIDTTKSNPVPNAALASAFPSVVEYSQNSLQYHIKKLQEEHPKAMTFDSNQVERIFTNTVYLSDDSIITFVKCLCEISEEEINHYSRNYSLIKLVEVIEYNLKRRIRLVFYNIWEIAVSHFTKIGSHQNIEISMHAIDSLRQLASKYMEREEMSNFNFQNEFLMPFETIMLNNQVLQIRELIIRCVLHLILSKAHNIKSGWKTILSVISIGSRVPSEPIVVLAYQAVEQILQSSFDFVEENFFANTIYCLTSFSHPLVHYPDICIKSLNQLDQLSLKILDRHNNLVSSSSDALPYTTKLESQLIPIIKGLSVPISHDNESVRQLSSSLLFKLLNKIGSNFSVQSWRHIINNVLLQMLAPIMPTNHSPLLLSDFEQAWVRQTCPSVLTEIINLFSNHHEVLSQFYPIVMEMFERLICNNNQSVSVLGCEYYCKFIQRSGVCFTNEHWTEISDSIGRILKHLLVKDPSASLVFMFSTESSLLGKELKQHDTSVNTLVPSTNNAGWTVSLLLMQRMTPVMLENYSHLSTQLCAQLVKYWSFVYHLTKMMSGNNNAQQQALHPDSQHTANNNMNETTALSCLLTLLFEMFLNQAYADRQAEIEVYLNNLCGDILNEVGGPHHRQPSTTMVAIVRQIADGFIKYSDEQFNKHMPQAYIHLVDLTVHDNLHIRTCIMSVFSRFGKGIPQIPDIQEPAPLPLEPAVANVKSKSMENDSILLEMIEKQKQQIEQQQQQLVEQQQQQLESHNNQEAINPEVHSDINGTIDGSDNMETSHHNEANAQHVENTAVVQDEEEEETVVENDEVDDQVLPSQPSSDPPKLDLEDQTTTAVVVETSVDFIDIEQHDQDGLEDIVKQSQATTTTTITEDAGDDDDLDQVI
ncbi:hypothetical protein SAMD00019534_104890 [Acytostelium subglobosum LB1]|uniref:hypothetical protein n=1 Tax=Acytostelium subglobosum LB1 TaxID=1410327 RepID=UPI000644E11C|nr:hypothetical protein SAMD00019534_104890 [Acytostelium subglobosum LB1]GAM27314.1 hypothetical protein SAMD00019534_104890 [Acytostelium subglobosum LB1]|eukprot:XP_012749781.1 hypothetical protein SAMD00019534_104890 [Acytostelium subglobosum LB1]